MADPPTQDLAFSTPETLELPEYRSLNKFGLFAFLLALLSPLALLHPLLLIFPVGSIVVAIITLWTIPDDQSGRGLAICGLLLATLFGAWGPSRFFSRQDALYTDAQQIAEEWLGIVSSNDLKNALQLTQRYFERQPDGTDLEEYYKPVEEGEQVPGMMGDTSVPYFDLVGYYQASPMLELSKNPGFEFEYVARSAIKLVSSTITEVDVVYRVSHANFGSMYILVTLERFLEDTTAYWSVSEVGQARAPNSSGEIDIEALQQNLRTMPQE